MKIKLDYASLSVWHVIASWIPFKSKRYIKKWTKIRNDWIGSIHVKYTNDMLRANIIWKSSFLFDQFPHSLRFAKAKGISIRDLWDDLLCEIANVENMRNVEELKIWLDTQII